MKNAQLGKKIVKLSFAQSLRKDISKLLGSVDIHRLNITLGNFIPHKMTVNLDMFCTFMKHRVIGKVESRLTITIQESLMPRELNNPFNRFSSQVAAAIERYSTSAEERETVVCFLVFHEIGELPNITKYAVKDRLVRGQLAQSASQYPDSRRSQLAHRKIPWLGLPCK